MAAHFRTIKAFAAPAIVLAVAACGDPRDEQLADPFGSAVVRLGDAVASEIDGTPIYVSDVRREAVALGVVDTTEPLDVNSPRFSETLEDLIHRRVLALEARRRELDDSDEARRRLAAAREVILYNMLIETVLDDAVTESALRTLYEEQSQLLSLGDEIRARHIIVPTSPEAEEVYGRLVAGDDFATLALEYSIDEPTRLDGGDLGYFSRGEIIIEEIERAAFDMDVGEISRPFRSQLGWHVMRVEDRRAEDAPAFEEMRPDLVRFLTYQELQRLSDILSSRADVRRFTGPAAAPASDTENETTGDEDAE